MIMVANGVFRDFYSMNMKKNKQLFSLRAVKGAAILFEMDSYFKKTDISSMTNDCILQRTEYQK